jgi:hypothetical protein
MLGFASVEEAMKVDLTSLYPDRASRNVFLGLLKEKRWLERNKAELRRQDGSLVHAVESAAGTFDDRGELAEIHGCLMDAGERPQTEPRLPQAPQKPRFHIKTFLSTAGAGRTIVDVPEKQILFEQGERGNAVFYILAGAVKLTVDSQGRKHNCPARPGELRRQGMHSDSSAPEHSVSHDAYKMHNPQD